MLCQKTQSGRDAIRVVTKSMQLRKVRDLEGDREGEGKKAGEGNVLEGKMTQ